jgi:hypothetical protein
MLTRRFHLSGLFAVLLALMAQLGISANVARVDPVATATALCHTDDDGGSTPSPAPLHSADCDVCPLCGTLHVQAAVLVAEAPILRPLAVFTIDRSNLPPASTAPPSLHRPPSQPRAPPTFS